MASTTKQAYHGNPENPAPCSTALSHPTALPYLPSLYPYPTPLTLTLAPALVGVTPPALPCPTLPYPTLPYPTLPYPTKLTMATPKTLPQLCPFSGNFPEQPRKPCRSYALSQEAYQGNPENPAPVPRKPCPSNALSLEAYHGNPENPAPVMPFLKKLSRGIKSHKACRGNAIPQAAYRKACP